MGPDYSDLREGAKRGERIALAVGYWGTTAIIVLVAAAVLWGLSVVMK